MDEQCLSTTADRNHSKQTFSVTHPFHPLYLQEFDLVVRRYNWGEDRAYYHDAQNDLQSILTRYTSLKAKDPFVCIAQDRAFFRTMDLLHLLDLISTLQD
jgi:Family of unknown function (DUF5372)